MTLLLTSQHSTHQMTSLNVLHSRDTNASLFKKGLKNSSWRTTHILKYHSMAIAVRRRTNVEVMSKAFGTTKTTRPKRGKRLLHLKRSGHSLLVVIMTDGI